MKKLTYLFTVVILLSGIVLTVFSPDTLTMAVVGIMCGITLLGIIFGLLPMISIINGFQGGYDSIQKAASVQTESAWMAAVQMEHFFRQRTLDRIFDEYKEKVRTQQESGLVVSDIEEYLNEDVLALRCWQGVTGQIPGTLTGLGIMGTFIGLLFGLRGIGFSTVENALSSVENILGGIDVAFYTSISGVILSIIFNISHNILRNMMNRELGMFTEAFHRQVIPAAEEQNRYRERREIRQIITLLERIPKNSGFSLSGTQGGSSSGNGSGNNESILMPQILDGLKKGEFVFYLQPRYELNTRKIVGSEALVRWNHSTLGVLSPSVFIPVLESNGYITKLDQYIWEDVCRTIRKWIDAGIHPLPVSLNVTKTDILAMDVAKFFMDMLEKYRIPPKYLDISIAESAYLQTHGAVSEAESRLMQAGFRVIVDGFNGDYLALDSAGRMSTDVLNLDLRYFGEGQKLENLSGVFERARQLHLTVFAEGIENMEQLTALRKCGCTEGQGFYFSKPLSVKAFEEKMKTGDNK